jgi:hypothetical protein
MFNRSLPLRMNSPNSNSYLEGDSTWKKLHNQLLQRAFSCATCPSPLVDSTGGPLASLILGGLHFTGSMHTIGAREV